MTCLVNTRSASERLLTDFQATFARRQDFAWVETILRIEQHLEVANHVERVRGKQLVHQLILLHPDAMLAGDRSSHGNTMRQNILARVPGFVEIAGLARIEQNDGMHVAVAGVKNVTDREP